MTKTERLTLGLQGKLYRLVCIKLDPVKGFGFKTITEIHSKQCWSKDQIKRMIAKLSLTNNYYRFETIPPDDDFWARSI